jgi:uncharacterized Ntn-hydrolase superfamily protein
MQSGLSAQEALSELIEQDAQASQRQVAFLDAQGNTAVHTGENCTPHANHIQGDGVVFQANLMLEPGVPEAMESSWNSTKDQPLERRLLAALFAAESAGGDLRGQMSAALIVAEPETEEDSLGVEFDLRVDHHSQPLEELARLVDQQSAFQLMIESEKVMRQGKHDLAKDLYAKSQVLAEYSERNKMWHAITLTAVGRDDEAAKILDGLLDRNPRMNSWAKRSMPPESFEKLTRNNPS